MKGIITIIIIIIIIVVGFLMLKDNTELKDSTNNVIGQAQLIEGEVGGDISDTIIEIDDSAIDTTAEIIVVTYNDKGFTPKDINIAVGQVVRFVNESSGNMWVASAQHPAHIVYSGTSLKDHCPDTDGTAFDQCESSDEYEFTFMKVGEWGYHNHVNPSNFGKVIVK